MKIIPLMRDRRREGHGWDVKCVEWHPTKGLLASGSKDKLVKFWDPRTGQALSAMYVSAFPSKLRLANETSFVIQLQPQEHDPSHRVEQQWRLASIGLARSDPSCL